MTCIIAVQNIDTVWHYGQFFPRFSRAYPLDNKISKAVIKELDKDLCTFGKPKVLLMDNDSEFLAMILKNTVEVVPHLKLVICLTTQEEIQR